MRVSVLYTDTSGTYRVRADIKENNRSVHIIDIIDDEYGTEADWDDFTPDEQGDIHHLLLEEYDVLDKSPDGNYNEGDDDSTEFDDIDSDY